MKALIYDDEYTGPRWRYGLLYRAAGIGCCPDGRIVFADRPHPRYPFGTIEYARQLTDHEVRQFSLDLLTS